MVGQPHCWLTENCVNQQRSCCSVYIQQTTIYIYTHIYFMQTIPLFTVQPPQCNSLWLFYCLLLIWSKIYIYFFALKLVLNVEKKKKSMLFLNPNFYTVVLLTSWGSQITSVSEYKYLDIIIYNTLHFGSHIKYLKQELKKKLGFYFRNKLCFSFNVRKKLVSATFLPFLDYGM